MILETTLSWMSGSGVLSTDKTTTKSAETCGKRRRNVEDPHNIVCWFGRLESSRLEKEDRGGHSIDDCSKRNEIQMEQNFGAKNVKVTQANITWLPVKKSCRWNNKILFIEVRFDHMSLLDPSIQSRLDGHRLLSEAVSYCQRQLSETDGNLI